MYKYKPYKVIHLMGAKQFNIFETFFFGVEKFENYSRLTVDEGNGGFDFDSVLIDSSFSNLDITS